MLSGKLKQLIEAITSIGYKISKLDCHHMCNVEILLCPVYTEKLTSNVKFLQLVETLSSAGFEITEYNILCDHPDDETKILLRARALSFSDFLAAVAAIPEHKNANGSGRSAASVAEQFKVSVSTVYQARKILKCGGREIIDSLREGGVPVKTAYKRLLEERKNIPVKQKTKPAKNTTHL